MFGLRKLASQVTRTSSIIHNYYGAAMQAIWSSMLPPSAMQPALVAGEWEREEEEGKTDSLFDGIIYFAVPKKKVNYVFIIIVMMLWILLLE